MLLLVGLLLVWVVVVMMQVAKAEEFLKRRIPVGSTFKTSRIQEEATGQVGR